MNTSNLSLFVVEDGTPKSELQVVKRNAFANAGCTVDSENNAVVNTSISKKGITIQIPLENMTSIEPYAFKTKAIYEFSLTAAEEERVWDENAVAGKYYYIQSSNGYYFGIAKFMGSTETRTMKDNAGNDAEITIYDMQYAATAGGLKQSSGHMGIGYSYRKYGYDFASMMETFAKYQSFVHRYEVLEGSIYYLGNAFNYISFGIFTYIHTNAFTDMEETRYAVYNNIEYDIWMDEEKIKAQDSSLFAEGWFEGRANSENTFMSSLLDHEDNYL